MVSISPWAPWMCTEASRFLLTRVRAAFFDHRRGLRRHPPCRIAPLLFESCWLHSSAPPPPKTLHCLLPAHHHHHHAEVLCAPLPGLPCHTACCCLHQEGLPELSEQLRPWGREIRQSLQTVNNREASPCIVCNLSHTCPFPPPCRPRGDSIVAYRADAAPS